GFFAGFSIIGEIQITLPTGLQSKGGPRNSYQLNQIVNWVRGTHSLKFGAQMNQHRDTQDFASGGVSPQFSNVQAFVDGTLNTVNVGFDFLANHATPGTQIQGPVTPPNRRGHIDFTDGAWFIEDTWKVSRRLTITPGLRWELT